MTIILQGCKEMSTNIDDLQNEMEHNELLKDRLLQEIVKTKSKTYYYITDSNDNNKKLCFILKNDQWKLTKLSKGPFFSQENGPLDDSVKFCLDELFNAKP